MPVFSLKDDDTGFFNEVKETAFVMLVLILKLLLSANQLKSVIINRRSCNSVITKINEFTELTL